MQAHSSFQRSIATLLKERDKMSKHAAMLEGNEPNTGEIYQTYLRMDEIDRQIGQAFYWYTQYTPEME